METLPNHAQSPVLPGREVPAGPDHRHAVQFYEGEAFLARVVANFMAPGLGAAGEPLVVIATGPHREAICAELTRGGHDVEAAARIGQLILLDAGATLAQLMIDGAPSGAAFRHHVGGLMERLGRAFGGRRIRAYGEMVDLLWRDGNRIAAIALEDLWNELFSSLPFTLLCTYRMGSFYRDGDLEQFQHVCRAHTHVLPTEQYIDSEAPEERLRQIAQLQQRALALETELRDREQLEQALRDALEDRRLAEARLAQSKQELQDFVDNAAEGLHWVGPDGVILWANRAELELLGYSEDEYVGHHIAEFHVDAHVIADILARLARNETLHGQEARMRTRCGDIRHVLLNSNVYVRDGTFIHSRCFTRDITDRKRVEEETRLRLEFEQQLLGIVSHDLRNPLNAITMSAALARARSSDERTTKALSRISSSAQRATHIISDLLDLTQARLRGGIPVNVRPCQLSEIAREVLDEHLAAHPGLPLRLVSEGDTRGVWDWERLAQALSNLVGNAIQHGACGAEILVRTWGLPETVGAAVHSAGVPIPAERLPGLFEPFKGSDRLRPRKSLGLGLYIVERIVSAHGGEVRCRSSADEGTVVELTLPRRPPEFGGLEGKTLAKSSG
jgi:PAS domain S-box-containing protein